MAVEVWELYLRGLVTGFALLLTAVSLLAYRRSPNRRLLFVAGALALFAVSGGLMVYAAFDAAFAAQLVLWLTVLMVAILVLLYLSMVQRVVTHRA